MQQRELGNSGLKVSAIGFGCMGLNFSYGEALSKEAAITGHSHAVAPESNPIGLRMADGGPDDHRPDKMALSTTSDVPGFVPSPCTEERQKACSLSIFRRKQALDRLWCRLQDSNL